MEMALAEWQFPRSLFLNPLVLRRENLVVTSGPYHLKVFFFFFLQGVRVEGASGARQGGDDEVLYICWLALVFHGRGLMGGIVGASRLSRSLWGKPLGADPEHQSEKKLAVQREGRRSTKGPWAL